MAQKLKVCDREEDGSVNAPYGGVLYVADKLFSEEGLKDILALTKEAKITGKPVSLKFMDNGLIHITPDTKPSTIAHFIALYTVANCGADLAKLRREEDGRLPYTNAKGLDESSTRDFYVAFESAHYILRTAIEAEEKFKKLQIEGRIGKKSTAAAAAR